MAVKLTAKAVENAKATSSRQEIPDGLLPGLYLVVQPSGAKSWAVRYRHNNRPRKMTLGKTLVLKSGEDAPPQVLGGYLTLAGARNVAREQLSIAAAGRDPGQERQQ